MTSSLPSSQTPYLSHSLLSLLYTSFFTFLHQYHYNPSHPFLNDLLTSSLSLSPMATNHLQSLSPLIKLQHQYSSDTSITTSSLFLKPPTSSSSTTTSSLSFSLSSNVNSNITSTTTFAISPTTSTTPSTSQSSSLELLQQHLSNQDFRQADEETRRLLIILAGEAAQKRGYVFFSEVQFIAEQDLKAIDELWRQYSNNKFGYSVQRRIWLQKANKDFTKFFLKVGWMKKLDTEVEQYNYRSFPKEFMWELNDDTPEGHLPLTNALRGTQLLNRILSHPAFEGEDEEEEEESSKLDEASNQNGGLKGLMDRSKPLNKKVFKSDYSF